MFAHGGNIRELAARAGREATRILDLSANINPRGPPECLRAVVSRHLEEVVHYPDPDCVELVDAMAARFSVRPAEVVAGNGSTDLLYALPRVAGVARALVPVPSYSDYVRASEMAGLEVETVALEERRGFALDWHALADRLRGDEMVVVGHPNNPTGLLFDKAAFAGIAQDHPSTTFVIDEAFMDFVQGDQSLIGARLSNVVVLRSMTKFYAIPGLRLGCAIASEPMADRLRQQVLPWSVNSLAQAVGAAVLSDEAYADRTRQCTRELREALGRALEKIDGFHVYPGAANYLLIRIDRPDPDAATLAERLLKQGIAIRVCSNYDGLDGRFFRVAVRCEEENERLCSALAAALDDAGRPSGLRARKRTPALSFQGTGSNVGKSILTAALCRILLQDGIRVAPFKAQNMSLNSYVTGDGGEMGRAQVVQAQACRIEPDVRMNPVLLKPSSDTGCQVIVRGAPVGNMSVAQYIEYKPQAFESACECYRSLAAEYDAVIIEGAGSPAEVNLKHHDIVNMQMARHAEAPVLIVGDIDRGGVFASFVGAMEVLAEWERRLVAGFVVNRFRGDASLLDDAIDYTFRHTGRPVLGVVPHIRDIGLPEEDSVSFKCAAPDQGRPSGDGVEVAVIDLPHISNFTDFDALRIESDVHVRIVRSPEHLDAPDAVVLPGSKNVLADLKALRANGLADAVLALAASGKAEIVGVCGGFQMLGKEIHDPHHVESTEGRAHGLGLLDVTTTLAAEKTLTRTRAVHQESGCEVSGYEIHHGRTSGQGLKPVLQHADGGLLGVGTPDGRIWGTYLHGVFDADDFRRWFIDALRRRRGLRPLGRPCATYDIEPALDRLADVVRAGLRMDDIYQLMRLE